MWDNLVAGPWMCAGLRSQTNDFQGCDIDTFHSYTTFLNALQHNSFEHVCTSIEHLVSSPASTKGAHGSAISLLYITFCFYPCQLLHVCDLLYQQVPTTWQLQCLPSARNFQLLLISLHLFTLVIAAYTWRVTWLKNNAFSLCLYTLKLYMVKHSTHSNSQQDCGLLLARSTRRPSTGSRHSTVPEVLFSACHTYNLAQCVECCVDRGVWYNWPFRLNCQPNSALIWR